jgi:hypothetical protein
MQMGWVDAAFKIWFPCDPPRICTASNSVPVAFPLRGLAATLPIRFPPGFFNLIRHGEEDHSCKIPQYSFPVVFLPVL